MKKLLEFSLDNGEIAFIEIEDNETSERQTTTRSASSNPNQSATTQRSFGENFRGDETTTRNNTDNSNQSTAIRRSFNEVLSVIQPTANSLLTALSSIDKPAEIKLEFGLTFNAKAGVVFTSAESEASFKVGITWKK